MQLKILSNKLLLVVLLGFLFSLGLIYFFIFKSSEEKSPVVFTANTTSPGKEKVNSPLPIRLKIPKINVDSAFEYVGLAADGRMDVPKGPKEVAWFDLGPRPGEYGSAVIAGHSGYKNDLPAAFDDLYKLKKGDKVYIEDEKGATLTFVVRESRSYGKNEDASNVFSLNDGTSHLNLVTCTGVWNEKEKTHADRLVVFTDKEMR